jgi:hypothetical protein
MAAIDFFIGEFNTTNLIIYQAATVKKSGSTTGIPDQKYNNAWVGVRNLGKFVSLPSSRTHFRSFQCKGDQCSATRQILDFRERTGQEAGNV